jgi:hypothetical protein
VSELRVLIKPTTIARLKLYEQDYESRFPLIDQVVDEAIHDYLRTIGW